MADLSAFPITKKWVPQDPTKLQLFSFPTPNGVKISTALEELGLEYEAHRVTLADADVQSAEFLSLSPNNKIPAIIDPNGPDGPIGLFESGAILIYLAKKTGKLTGQTASDKAHAIQWLMWQMGGLGPMLGQLGFFVKFAGSQWEDKRPQARYVGEAKRLLGVLDRHLEGRDWVVGDDLTIADIAIAPWLGALNFYEAKDHVGWDTFTNLQPYLDRFTARPTVQRAMNIPPREG